MILSKRQYWYLNQQVILFRLQYETHSLQMHLKSPCRSVVTPMPKLSKGQYYLRLVVVPCQYLPSPLTFFQSIYPSPSSHISSVTVLYLLRRRIHPCCSASTPTFSSTTVFTAGLVCHSHYPVYPPRPNFHPPACMLLFSSYYYPSSRVLCRRCLSTLSDRIFSSICIVLYYTA